MSRHSKSNAPDRALSFAIEPLEPRLLLTADWALGMAPDDARQDPFDLDADTAARFMRELAAEPSAPAAIDIQRFVALQASTDAPTQDDGAKPDRQTARMQTGDAPSVVDDNFEVDEDNTLDFTAVWFDPNWIARTELTFDNSTSSEDLTDFPILVVLDSSRIDYGLTLGDGDDLRFTDAAGNLLEYEIEVWDETGTSYVWVRVGNIAAGSTSDSIFMYYGNPDASEGQSPLDVWGPEFEQVQHLDENSGNYDDSTANNVDIDLATGGDNHGAASFIGPAHQFDGSNELDSQNDALAAARERGTISLWVQFNERTGQINLLNSTVERDQALWTDDGTFRASMADGATNFRDLSGGSIQNGWNQVVFSWDSATGQMWLYANGQLVDQLDGAPWSPDGLFGNDINIGGDTPPFFGFLPARDGLDGGIDELRVANVVRSADWVAAQFATINDAFITYGAEETAARGVLANDTDPENDPLRAVLESGPSNAASFTLFADGSFQYTPVADFVGTDTFTYRADDGNSLSGPATVTITVNAVNDAPTFTLGGTQNVLEDPGSVAVAGFAVANTGGGADEAGQSFSYTITTDNDALFAVMPIIDGAGTLTYTLAPNANGTANIQVELTDSGGTANGGTNTAPLSVFAINVAPVNDAPSATFLGDQTVLENAGPQTIAGFASGLPGGGADEVSQTLTYTVTTSQTELFSVAPTISPDGTLTFTFANNASGVANVEVVVTDSGGTVDGGNNTSQVYTFDLTATAVSAPPTATNMNQLLTYLEDSPLGLDNIVISDANAGEVVTATLTLSDPLAGSLSTTTGSGETYVAATGRWRITGTVGEVNAALAAVAFIPAADYAQDTSIAVSIVDAAGTGPADGLITLQAIAVNDAPTATLLGPLVVQEDAGAQTFAGFATAFAGGGSDETGQTFTYVVSTDRPELFSVAPSIAPDGTLTFTLADNANGTTTVRVRVIDSGGTDNGGQNQSTDYMFGILIGSQPDAPTATNMTQLVGYTEDGAPVGFNAIVVSDNDADEIITATLTLADPLAGTLSVPAGSGASYDAGTGQWQVSGTASEVNTALAGVTFTSSTDFAFDTAVVVRITDAAGTGPADGLITLQASAVNDAPLANLPTTLRVTEDAGPQTIAGFVAAFAGGGADEDGQTFRFDVATDNAALFRVAPLIAPDGTLSFTTADNASGTALVRVRVVDSGGTTNAGQDTSIEYVFRIIVDARPDAPLATNTVQTVGYTEDEGPVSFAAIVVTDADAGDVITATLTLADPAAGTLNSASSATATYDAVSGQWQIRGTTSQVNAALAGVQYDPAANFARDTSIAVRIEDADGNRASDGLLTLQGTAVNDAPVASQLNQVQRLVEDAMATALDVIVVSDVDDGDTVLATLTLNQPDAGALSSNSGQGESYDAISGVWRVSGSPAQVSAALASVTFQPATDFAGSVAIATSISDEAGAGPPPGEIQLEVLAVNDAPTVSLAGNIAIAEDTPLQRVVGFASVIDNGGDDERGQTLTFEVSTDNPSLFSVLPGINAAGELSYEVAPDANGTANITVLARDDGGRDNGGEDAAPELSFQLQIDPVNDAPQASNRFVVAPPSGIVVLSTGAFGFDDPTDGDRFDGIFISTLPAQGQLLLDGVALDIGAFVSAEDIAANRLLLSSQAAPGDSLLLNFNFLVRDTGGTDAGGQNVSSKTSTVTVAVDVPATGNSPALQTQDASEDEANPDAPVETNTQRSPVEILAAEPELPEVNAVFNLEPAQPPLPTFVAAFEPAAATTPGSSGPAVAIAPERDAGSPGVTRVAAIMLEGLRDAIPQATVVDAPQASTALVAATDVLVEQLTDLREGATEAQAAEELVVMQSSAVAFGLSVGYVSWLLRGGVLLSSMLTSLPAWRFIDPLPIFSGIRQQDDDDESLQDIVTPSDTTSGEERDALDARS